MGVGTLIIFIALILVAAVAAGVVIQTASSLQQQALATGQAARGEVATNARVLGISATDGSEGQIENFSMQMKLAPGSNPIKLDEVTLTFNTDNSTTTLQYDEDLDFATSGGTGTFNVQYLINGSNNRRGNFVRGDVIRIDFQSPRQINENEKIRINVVPRIGAPTLVEVNAPDVISTERVYLYP